MIRAAGRRVADADEFELAELVALRDELDRAIADAVAGQRTGPAERSWQSIGDALGMTRQAAHKRYAEHAATYFRPDHLRLTPAPEALPGEDAVAYNRRVHLGLGAGDEAAIA